MQQIRLVDSSVVVTVGGGISRIDEIAALRDAGASAVLVGSRFTTAASVHASSESLSPGQFRHEPLTIRGPLRLLRTR